VSTMREIIVYGASAFDSERERVCVCVWEGGAVCLTRAYIIMYSHSEINNAHELTLFITLSYAQVDTLAN